MKTRRRKPWPQVRKVVRPSGRVDWCVDGRLNGTGERHFFATKQEAETKADSLRITRTNEGTRAASMPERLRIEATECEDLLRPLGVSLTDAVRYYIAHARPEGGEKTIEDLNAEFLERKRKAGRRATYLSVQRAVLGKFAQTFGAANVHEITTRELSEWMDAQAWTARTRKNYQQDLSNLFGFAKRQGYCASNPFDRMERHTLDQAPPPGILTPKQAEALLRAAQKRGDRLTAFFAIGLFAGLRPVELLELDWSNLDLEQGTIAVTSTISKTRDHRYVTIADNLKAWLAPLAKESGRITPTAWRYESQQTRKAAGIHEWPHDATRHSFATYHFAQHHDAAKTAAELGHRGDTRTLFAHYRALAKPSDAANFWGIRP
jgi:integrase